MFKAIIKESLGGLAGCVERRETSPAGPLLRPLREILTEASWRLLDVLGSPGRCPIMNEHEISVFGHRAMVIACIFGLVCAAVGGLAGLPAAAWMAAMLVIVWRAAAPGIGTTLLGFAAIYGLGAGAGLTGSDPENVDSTTNARLAVVAVGCAVVGLTSAVVWVAERCRAR